MTAGYDFDGHMEQVRAESFIYGMNNELPIFMNILLKRHVYVYVKKWYFFY